MLSVSSRIGTEAIAEGRPVAIRSPSDLSDIVGEALLSGPHFAGEAVATARRGQALWAAIPLIERSRILIAASRRISDDRTAIAATLSREQGKTLPEALGEVERAADIFAYFSGEVLRLHGELYPSSRLGTEISVLREPVGVVLAITPWNFPLAIPASKCAAALAYGNAVILKPSELTPFATRMLVDHVVGAGVPAEAFSYLLGDGTLGAALAASPGIDAISFTGSVATGRAIKRAALENDAALQFEMGGKNVWIVLDDADAELAARLAAESAFLGTGQRCTASSIVLATPGIRERLHDHLEAQLTRFPVGPASDPATRVGPLVSRAQAEKFDGFLAIAAAEDHVVHSAPLRNDLTEGHYRAPAMVLDVAPTSPLATEEIFGPMLVTLDVADLDAAIALANASPYGLSAGLCTRSSAAATRFVAGIEAGIVTVNLPTAGSEHHVPFGGLKASSHGPRENSSHVRDFFSRTRTIYRGPLK
jgi:acyl-CoA reductase-like NAD-dependent aldehyde dehydrogenase